MTASELLAEARKHLAWRNGFKSEPPEKQTGMIYEHARELCLYAAPIGKSATRIGAALDELVNAIGEHLGAWPDDQAAEDACKEALAAAGVLAHEGYHYTGYTSTHFNHLAAELNVWLGVLQVAWDRLEACGEPDVAFTTDEWQKQGRTAA